MGNKGGCGQVGVSPCSLGLCGNVPGQKQDGSGEKSLGLDGAGSALWDQAQQQSRVTLAEPRVPPLVPTWNRSSPQLRILLILQVSPFKARAREVVQWVWREGGKHGFFSIFFAIKSEIQCWPESFLRNVAVLS